MQIQSGRTVPLRGYGTFFYFIHAMSTYSKKEKRIICSAPISGVLISKCKPEPGVSKAVISNLKRRNRFFLEEVRGSHGDENIYDIISLSISVG
jgi:hypothetical protein